MATMHSAPAEPRAGRLAPWTLAAFAAPTIPLTMMLAPLGSILPAYYARHTAVSLAAIGMVLFLTRITDAVADQVVGYLSDITRTRFGPRKPWIAAGTLVSMVSVYLMLTPRADTGPAAFFVWTLLLMLGWTMIYVPLAAWGSELSRDYGERARISGYMALAGPIGALIVFALPLLPMFGSTAITADVLRGMAIVIVAMLPLSVALMLAVVPRGQTVASESPSIRQAFQAIRRNRPFWRFLAFAMVGGLVIGMIGGLLVLYMDNYLGLGSKIAYLFLLNLVASLVGVPIWARLVKVVGKHRVIAFGAIYNLLFLLPPLWLIKPGHDAFPQMMIWMGALGLSSASSTVVFPAMMGDIVDYDIWKTNANRAGNYFAFLGLMQKSMVALGGAISFGLLGALGFDAKAAVVTPHAAFGLLITISALPGLFSVLAIALVWNYPLDQRRHSIIRRRIEQRAARASPAAEAGA
jgi:glycoside/pentoside/hexuronide:cation symporter, GPH family